MQDLLENILNDIYTLDPSLREQEDDVRALVMAFLAEKPKIQVDKQFAKNLRESLVASKLIEKKTTQNTLSWWMYLTPVGVAAVIILMLTPKIPSSVVPTAIPESPIMENSAESEMVPEFYDATNAKRSVETVGEDASMMMQMSADSLPVDSFGIATQVPSNTILIDFALLSQPGYIAIFSEEMGLLGELVGVTSLLYVGQSEQISIPLSIVTEPDQTYIGVLYYDDGDGVFNKELDIMATDMSGLPMQQMFSTTPIVLQ